MLKLIWIVVKWLLMMGGMIYGIYANDIKTTMYFLIILSCLHFLVHELDEYMVTLKNMIEDLQRTIDDKRRNF